MNGESSDAALVDAMILHQEGAPKTAEAAPNNAEHEEIRTLSWEIIDAQQAEIEELGRIKDDFGG